MFVGAYKAESAITFHEAMALRHGKIFEGKFRIMIEGK